MNKRNSSDEFCWIASRFHKFIYSIFPIWDLSTNERNNTLWTVLREKYSCLFIDIGTNSQINCLSNSVSKKKIHHHISNIEWYKYKQFFRIFPKIFRSYLWCIVLNFYNFPICYFHLIWVILVLCLKIIIIQLIIVIYCNYSIMHRICFLHSREQSISEIHRCDVLEIKIFPFVILFNSNQIWYSDCYLRGNN